MMRSRAISILLLVLLLLAGCGEIPTTRPAAGQAGISATAMPTGDLETPYPLPEEPYPAAPTPWIIPTCTAGPPISPGPTSEPGQPTPPPTATPACRPQPRPTMTPEPTFPPPTPWLTPEITPAPVAHPPFIPDLPQPEPFQVLFQVGVSFWTLDSRNPQPQLIVDVRATYSMDLYPDPARSPVSISPDGRRLALALTEAQASPGSWWTREVDLYLYDRDAGQLSLLVEDAGGPQWAPDGEQIAYYKDDALWVLDTTTGESWAIFAVPEEADLGAVPLYPSWSPDGAWLAFLYYPRGVYDPAQAMAARTDGSGETISYPGTPAYFSERGSVVWAPDGSRLLYVTYNRTQNCSGPVRCINLWIASADGRNAVQLLPPIFGATGGLPQWSPDGDWVVFSSVVHFERIDPAHNLWLARADGSLLLRLTDACPGEANEIQPTWTRDGTRIVFRRQGQGLWTLDLADGSLLQLYPQAVDSFIVR